MKKDESITEVMARRWAAEKRAIEALNHLPRSQALSVIMSYVPLDRLEEGLPTICGSEDPVTDPVEAFAHRLKMAAMARDLQPAVIVLNDARKGAKRRPKDELERLTRETFMEALR